MAWLHTLGPIQANFSTPSITFAHNDTSMTLQGDPTSQPNHTTFHQLKHLIHSNTISSLHLLIFQPTNSITNTKQHNPLVFGDLPPDINPQLSDILHKYPIFLNSQSGLPSTRPHDHHINLIPNTPPINLKPYYYPHSQKEAMTSIIEDMLREKTIIPSNNPFSSPVLLVKKKDDTWGFCVDYHTLNAVTIKDRFPIPIIDELLNELGSAKVLTKLDLCSDYHQIRVASEDTHKTSFQTFMDIISFS